MNKKASILTKSAFDEHIKYAKAEFENKGEFTSPLLIFNLGDRLYPMRAGQLFRDFDKRIVMSHMKNYFKEEFKREIEEVVMIFESWYVAKKGKLDFKMRPSESPDRQEAVMIMGRDKAGKKFVSYSLKIDRKKNRLIEDKKLTGADRFVGLLDYIFDTEGAELLEHSHQKNKIN